ncbi:MAG: cupin domain-containing protein [Candidatus Aenigmarchaeota archaeon]|nr:cupin domain-containing protein [Candidatus Aenigmarchaeota archaeon]
MKIEVRKPTEDEIKSTESWGTWEKEPSEFDWEYGEKETCYILEGSATVTASDGESASFGAGDWVVFPPGLKCKWKIDKEIKKKYKLG